MLNLEHQLTQGIISGLSRTISSPNRGTIYNGIRTDAAINPGNSGGPLLDSKGRLIGMNTAIYSTSGSFSGIGFAIPVDLLKVIVKSLIRDGKVSRKPIGLSFLGERQSKSLGINVGLVILNVEPGTPAEYAGLRGLSSKSSSLLNISLGDVIIKVNGINVESEGDFLAAIDQNVAGDTIDLRVLRLLKTVEGRKDPPKPIETTIKLRLA
jgi:S1-C subfamily serine protease